MQKAWRRDPWTTSSSWCCFHHSPPSRFQHLRLPLLSFFSSRPRRLRYVLSLFLSTTETERKTRALIAVWDKDEKLLLVVRRRLWTPARRWLTAHMDTQACIWKLHPVMYNHYRQAASLQPAGSFPSSWFYFSPSPPLGDKRKRFPGRNRSGMNHRPGWVDWQQPATHTHEHTSPPAADEAPSLKPWADSSKRTETSPAERILTREAATCCFLAVCSKIKGFLLLSRLIFCLFYMNIKRNYLLGCNNKEEPIIICWIFTLHISLVYVMRHKYLSVFVFKPNNETLN